MWLKLCSANVFDRQVYPFGVVWLCNSVTTRTRNECGESISGSPAAHWVLYQQEKTQG